MGEMEQEVVTTTDATTVMCNCVSQCVLLEYCFLALLPPFFVLLSAPLLHQLVHELSTLNGLFSGIVAAFC